MSLTSLVQLGTYFSVHARLIYSRDRFRRVGQCVGGFGQCRFQRLRALGEGEEGGEAGAGVELPPAVAQRAGEADAGYTGAPAACGHRGGQFAERRLRIGAAFAGKAEIRVRQVRFQAGEADGELGAGAVVRMQEGEQGETEPARGAGAGHGRKVCAKASAHTSA